MLKQENVSGDIALRFFDHDGQECNTILKERMISISMEQFKKINRKISLVSGVSKANAVLSALKGGLVDVLILDSNLAEALVKTCLHKSNILCLYLYKINKNPSADNLSTEGFSYSSSA